MWVPLIIVIYSVMLYIYKKKYNIYIKKKKKELYLQGGGV
jgi:hypothetical protein